MGPRGLRCRAARHKRGSSAWWLVLLRSGLLRCGLLRCGLLACGLLSCAALNPFVAQQGTGSMTGAPRPHAPPAGSARSRPSLYVSGPARHAGPGAIAKVTSPRRSRKGKGHLPFWPRPRPRERRDCHHPDAALVLGGPKPRRLAAGRGPLSCAHRGCRAAGWPRRRFFSCPLTLGTPVVCALASCPSAGPCQAPSLQCVLLLCCSQAPAIAPSIEPRPSSRPSSPGRPQGARRRCLKLPC